MTAAWVPADTPVGPVPPRPHGLRLVSDGGRVVPGEAPVRRARRVPIEVRRRRTLLGAIGLLLVGLALPLGGTGGHSHATGSAPAGPGSYIVRPGDTLWSIAQRAAPSADPRPLVTQLAAQVGSDRVVPGERIVVP